MLSQCGSALVWNDDRTSQRLEFVPSERSSKKQKAESTCGQGCKWNRQFRPDRTCQGGICRNWISFLLLRICSALQP